MKKGNLFTAFFLSLFCSCSQATSQEVEGTGLVWESKSIHLGAVLEENGVRHANFNFVNKTDDPIVIQEVVPDCGCTAAEFTKDTVFQDQKGNIQIAFDPKSRPGVFSKMILVKTNLDEYVDTLVLEGINVPYPEDLRQYYGITNGGLGFRFGIVNLGSVYTNASKVKYIDFYNYENYPLQLNNIQEKLPAYVKAKLTPSVVKGKSRGVLELHYDPLIKGDLGFFEETFVLSVLTYEKREIRIKTISTIYEHFDPVPINEIDNLPKLAIRDKEVELNKIREDLPISKIVVLENKGPKPLNIRKVVTNCACVSVDLPKEDLEPGEKTDLTITFNPEGRRGIDHKTLTVFSNDPLNPTQTIMIKSRIN
ncbi:DUF1573 domain-containing protein [Pleomorphovibrio marinus]|uniref:DUF1573 domain-containing protein n=1 Tax=Pleomorphovibrio marinus TaxID=2164132 RepID=UPI0018E5907D|nr:DUF1573 domain-containing protein [Pleomorphovibrio marinus]